MENHNYKNEGQFQRKMTSRHLFMLSLGRVISTGLFLSSGYTLSLIHIWEFFIDFFSKDFIENTKNCCSPLKYDDAIA